MAIVKHFKLTDGTIIDNDEGFNYLIVYSINGQNAFELLNTRYNKFVNPREVIDVATGNVVSNFSLTDALKHGCSIGVSLFMSQNGTASTSLLATGVLSTGSTRVELIPNDISGMYGYAIINPNTSANIYLCATNNSIGSNKINDLSYYNMSVNNGIFPASINNVISDFFINGYNAKQLHVIFNDGSTYIDRVYKPMAVYFTNPSDGAFISGASELSGRYGMDITTVFDLNIIYHVVHGTIDKYIKLTWQFKNATNYIAPIFINNNPVVNEVTL